MKRVLVIISTAFVQYGGLTTVALNYFYAMDKKHVKMDFASSNEIDKELLAKIEKQGGNYILLPKRSNVLLYMKAIYALMKHYDILHVHANSATAVLELFPAKLRKTPRRLIHIHTSICNHRILHALVKPLFNRCYTEALACSDLAGAWIFKKNGFTILNNAIDTEKYRYSEKARTKMREEKALKDKFVVGHIGKMMESKNHLYLIDIFARIKEKIPSAVLVLVGDGKTRKDVDNKVKEYGINGSVLFEGMKTNISEYMSLFDCFLFPSLWEGMPLALIEAQAAGLSCIVSDCVTESANVTGTVQFLPLTTSVDDWSNAALKLPEQERAMISELNIEKIKAQNFDIYRNAACLESIYLSTK